MAKNKQANYFLTILDLLDVFQFSYVFLNKFYILNPFGGLVGLSFIYEEKETEP